jgi:hypothetical protein
MEEKTLSLADILTTVSQPLADELEIMHKKPAYSIPNGFDPYENDKKNSRTLSKKFSIVYTGVLYNCRRNPENLFVAVREMIDEGMIQESDLNIDFYGSDLECLTDMIDKYQLTGIIHCYSEISRELALIKQREAQILLLLKWNNPQEKGVYTGKIFDYLAAQRPILSIGCKGGVVSELLEETSAGYDLMEIPDIKNQIKIWYMDFQKNGYVKYCGDLVKIEQYSQPQMAKKFSSLLDKLI